MVSEARVRDGGEKACSRSRKQRSPWDGVVNSQSLPPGTHFRQQCHTSYTSQTAPAVGGTSYSNTLDCGGHCSSKLPHVEMGIVGWADPCLVWTQLKITASLLYDYEKMLVSPRPPHFLIFKSVIISQATRVLPGLVEPIRCLNVVTAQYVIVTTCHLDCRQNSRSVWCDFHRGVPTTPGPLLVSYIVGFLCVPL